MRRFLNRCFCSFLMLLVIAAFLGGLYAGFHLGKESVCGDVAFYYHNDLPIKACVATNTKGLK